MKTRLRTEDGQNIINSCSAEEIIKTLQEYIDKYGQYGPVQMYVYGLADIEIEYRSPETLEEIEVDNAKVSAAEKHERAEYERLKEKYGD